jgi:phytoene dehydrogenase-like protein
MKNITIIGAGLGGLTAGALLAKEGQKVTILEQHNIVGGCATTFKRGDFTCEVGLHEMEGVHTNPMMVETFKKLGVYEHVEFVKANEFFSVTTKHGKFVMPDGVENVKKALLLKFPDEKKGIESYFKTIQKIAESFEKLLTPSWYHFAFFPFLFWDILLYKPKSVTDVLDKIIKNEELKLILNTNVQYYSDSPDNLSFLLHAVAQYSYYQGGGWFIKGGSGRLSDYLAKVIKENGGEIITKATVTACEKERVSYRHKKESKSIASDIIISNLSPKQTYQLYEKPYSETKEIADSLMTIYLGFRKNLKEIYGKRAYSNFIFDDIGSVEEFNEMMKKDIFQRVFVFVDYAQIDSGLTNDNKSFGAICTPDFLSDWESVDKESYKKKKENLIASMLTKLETEYPNISELVEYAEVGTAKTVERYIKTPNGTAYGFKPTSKQFFRIPKVKSDKVKNLYFVGQWVIAGGFSPAIMSGGVVLSLYTVQIRC